MPKVKKKTLKIAKMPLFVPKFDETLTQMVSDFMFLPQSQISNDCMLQVLGNLAFTDSMKRTFDSVTSETVPSKIMFCGGKNPRYHNPLNFVENAWVKFLTHKVNLEWKDVLTRSEASILSRKLMGKIEYNGNPLVVWEQDSRNTKENFDFPSKCGYYGHTKKLVLLGNSMSAVRSKMTALTALKGTEIESIDIISYPEQIPFKNKKLRDAFTITPQVFQNGNFIAKYIARQMIYGELKRIQKYSEIGHCQFFDENHKRQFDEIINRIKSR